MRFLSNFGVFRLLTLFDREIVIGSSWNVQKWILRVFFTPEVYYRRSLPSQEKKNLGNRPKMANFRSWGTFWPWLTRKSLPCHSETFRYAFYAYCLPRRSVTFTIDGLSQEKLILEVHRKARIFGVFGPFGPGWQRNRYRIALKLSGLNSTRILYPGGVPSFKPMLPVRRK